METVPLACAPSPGLSPLVSWPWNGRWRAHAGIRAQAKCDLRAGCVKARRSAGCRAVRRRLEGDSEDATVDVTQWAQIDAAARNGNAGLRQMPRPAMSERPA